MIIIIQAFVNVLFVCKSLVPRIEKDVLLQLGTSAKLPSLHPQE